MIAISYRREDSLPIAGRLYDRLQAKFGKKNVFMDFDSIPPGSDFRQQIKDMIKQSNVVIAIIGPHWLGEQPGTSRRIDNPADFVRLEIAYALQAGIPVIPLLIDTTQMPKPEMLPLDIRELAFRHALPLDSGMDFHSHADRLIAGIGKATDAARKRRRFVTDSEKIRSASPNKDVPRTSAGSEKPKRKQIDWTWSKLLVGTAVALLFAVAASVAWYVSTHQREQEDGATPQPADSPALGLNLGRPSPHGVPATPDEVPAVLAPNLSPMATTTPSAPLFSIAQVKATETLDPDAETNLTLRITVTKQANAAIDNAKVKIQVFFYDTVDDKDIKLTDVDVNYEWVTPKHDWAGADPEVLAATYVRPKNKMLSSEGALSAAVSGKPTKPVQRRYLGYIVRVYYHDELQATKAEPKRLLRLFPASLPQRNTERADDEKSRVDAATFAGHAREMREKAVGQIEPQVFIPTASTAPPVKPSSPPQPNDTGVQTPNNADTGPIAQLVGRDVKILNAPKPSYPRELEAKGVGGSGRFEINFDEDGSAKSIQIIQSTGNRFLDSRTVSTLMQWKASPGSKSKIVVPITFAKPKSSPKPANLKAQSKSPTPSRSTPTSQKYPYGLPVKGKPNVVESPYSPGKYVDIEGFRHGTEVKDPYTGKIFLVP